MGNLNGVNLHEKNEKKKKIQKEFARRYCHCNWCDKDLNIRKNEEIVCLLCGETFCEGCISKHQRYCYNRFY